MNPFFYFSKTERFLIIVLLLMAGGWMAVLWFTKKETQEIPLDTVDSTELVAFMKEVRPLRSKPYRYATRFTREERVLHPMQFDPNTADSATLTAIGLPAYVIHNLLQYRRKGGSIRTSEAFARIYGVTPELYASLRGFIRIDKASPSQRDSLAYRHMQQRDTLRYTHKLPVGTLVDLNAADTTLLKQIPGVGSGLAKLIVAYRNRLGGFASVQQVSEVPYAGKELFHWFEIRTPLFRKIPVNGAYLEQLRAHPYLNFYQAKAIVEYRRKRGKIISLSQLSLFEEFTEKDLKRLTPYLSFDE